MFCKFPSLSFLSAYGKLAWERNWSKALPSRFRDVRVDLGMRFNF